MLNGREDNDLPLALASWIQNGRQVPSAFCWVVLSTLDAMPNLAFVGEGLVNARTFACMQKVLAATTWYHTRAMNVAQEKEGNLGTAMGHPAFQQFHITLPNYV